MGPDESIAVFAEPVVEKKLNTTISINRAADPLRAPQRLIRYVCSGLSAMCAAAYPLCVQRLIRYVSSG